MRAVVIKSITAAVLAVSVIAVGLGLATPDGSVRSEPATTPSSAAPSTTDAAHEPAAPSPDPPADPAALSPVTGVWPGRPATTVETAGVVDWCPAVDVTVSAAVSRAVGDEAARQAACRAIAFTFDVRYSALSLPRQTYAVTDFAVVLPHLSETTASSTYPSRVTSVIAAPRSTSAREGTGVVLLDGPTPGQGRAYFGSPWSLDGYAGRPVWIDPTWSTIRVELMRSGQRPQLRIAFDATAAVPVWNASTGSAEKLTVKTSGSYVMAGPDWRVNGWTLRTDQLGFSPLG